MAFQFSITSLPFPKVSSWERKETSNASISSNTLANLFQFFSILSDLKCYRNTFSSFANHLLNA
jgi:hypothetical protein